MDENECSKIVIGAAIEVHRHLGPGLLEAAYEKALAIELDLRGLRLKRQVTLPATYKGNVLEDAYRLDIVVEELVVVEVKSVERLLAVHAVQLHTYLRFYDKRLGPLFNFNGSTMRGGIKRVVNGLYR